MFIDRKWEGTGKENWKVITSYATVSVVTSLSVNNVSLCFVDLIKVVALMQSLSIPAVFTVQDRPSPGREEDWEAPWKTDETHGVQRDAYWCNGNGLKCSNPLGAPGLSSVDVAVVESTVPSECDVETERWAIVKRESDEKLWSCPHWFDAVRDVII